MKLKICGLSRPDDIRYVNEACVDYAGFIINFPKSHRNVSPEKVLSLKKLLSPDIKAVGVFVDEEISVICGLYTEGAIDIIQLHGHEDNEYINKLRAHVPDAEIWKAFKIRSNDDILECVSSSADKILLDNGYGTGQHFDWSLVNNIERPFILAGGLTPENIPKAIRLLNPWGIDISSGVETNGYKDKNKIIAAAFSCK